MIRYAMTNICRCAAAAGLAALTAVSGLAQPATAPLEPAPPTLRPEEVDAAFAKLIGEAQRLAQQPYEAARAPLPEALAELSYDAARDIRCPPEKFLWAGTDAPFRVQFKHRGWLFTDEVDIFTLRNAAAEPQAVPFSPQRFTYGPIAREAIDPQTLPASLGYAGMSIHQSGDTPKSYSEIVSILGGSYFRAVGDGQHWGSSARGIAIDTGLETPEEFPRWVEFWVERPGATQGSLAIYALMDGPSVVGAYRLLITPGKTLTVGVSMKLFFRQSVEKLGLAPITSMFLFGEARPAGLGDYRPEVHDSDGLLIKHSDGRFNWRPLTNPAQTTISRFALSAPAGFGLMQRDRDFRSYQDLETEMQLRPSVWVTPRSDWGAGHIELIEFPSDSEGNDNIACFWVPADRSMLEDGGELAMQYTVAFTRQPRSDGGKFTDTRYTTRQLLGQGGVTQQQVRPSETNGNGDRIRFLLDAAGGTLDHIDPQNPPRAEVQVSGGKLIGEPVVQFNRFSNSWRLFFDVKRQSHGWMDLAATLYHDQEPVTETWLYRWDRP